MAKLDDLIAQVRDGRLRSELANTARDLRKRTRFGLVFEEHIPEITLLRDFPIRTGMTVCRKTDTKADEPHRVVAVNGATITAQAHGKKQPQEFSAEELLVLKRFGDPIYPALAHLLGSGR